MPNHLGRSARTLAASSLKFSLGTTSLPSVYGLFVSKSFPCAHFC